MQDIVDFYFLSIQIYENNFKISVKCSQLVLGEVIVPKNNSEHCDVDSIFTPLIYKWH